MLNVHPTMSLDPRFSTSQVTICHCRGRPWRYSVIPSTPDFPTEYQIRQNSNPAGLPVIAANWGPGFRARTIILTHMFKQIKQIRTPDARLTKWSTGNLYATSRNMGWWGVTRVIEALFILRVASLGSCLVLCECATSEVTSTLVNCNEVGSQLPHRTLISRSSCLKKPGERNDVLEFSIRLQNV